MRHLKNVFTIPAGASLYLKSEAIQRIVLGTSKNVASQVSHVNSQPHLEDHLKFEVSLFPIENGVRAIESQEIPGSSIWEATARLAGYHKVSSRRFGK